MKKLSFLLLSLLAVTLFTACNKDDNPNSRQTFSSHVNIRTISGDDVLFSQATTQIEVDYINSTIMIQTGYKDMDGMGQNIATSKMPMSIKYNAIYRFGPGENGLQGYLDFTTGMLWFSFNHDPETKVYCTSNLLYAYTNTNMTNPENNNHGANQQSAYMFIPGANGETCELRISNFMSTLNGVVDAPEVRYNGLTMTPTTTGYTITAANLESSYKGFYTLTDVNFTLNDQCQLINGSFKCNGINYEVTGDLFPAGYGY